MKVGIFHYLSTAYSIDPAVLAKRAEEFGFDSLWLPEHPIMPVTTISPFPLGGPIPHFYAEIIDPFVGLARASAVTQTIKLGTGICLIPERNPLLLAKEIATLDHFSGGKCHEMANIISTQAPQLHALEQALTGELRERLKEWVLA